MNKITFLLNESLEQTLLRLDNKKLLLNLYSKTYPDSYDNMIMGNERQDIWEHTLSVFKNEMIAELESAAKGFPERVQIILINWLISIALKGYLKFEDLYKSNEYFINFFKYKNKIKQKDITKYNSLQEIYQAFKPFLDLENSLIDPKSVTDAILVYEDENCIIMSPETVQASCALGKGTEWCTAVDPKSHNNMFEYYNNDGPLLIYFDKHTKRRIQFHENSKQMMNEEDIEICYPYFYKILFQLKYLDSYDTHNIKFLKDGGIAQIKTLSSSLKIITYFNKEGLLRQAEKGPYYVVIRNDEIVNQYWSSNGVDAIQPTEEQRKEWENKVKNNNLFESKIKYIEFRNIL